MYSRTARLALCAALLSAAATPATAHHAFSMYDQAKLVTLEGTVHHYNWMAPHTHIIFTAQGDAAAGIDAGDWDIEGPGPNILVRQGWNKLTLKEGDRITLATHPLRSGEKGGSLVYAVINGVTWYPDAGRPAQPAADAASAPAAR